jgi:hypothetical protein
MLKKLRRFRKRTNKFIDKNQRIYCLGVLLVGIILSYFSTLDAFKAYPHLTIEQRTAIFTAVLAAYALIVTPLLAIIQRLKKSKKSK